MRGVVGYNDPVKNAGGALSNNQSVCYGCH